MTRRNVVFGSISVRARRLEARAPHIHVQDRTAPASIPVDPPQEPPFVLRPARTLALSLVRPAEAMGGQGLDLELLPLKNSSITAIRE